MPVEHTSDSNALIQQNSPSLYSNPCTCQKPVKSVKKLGCMKNSISSIRTQRIARALLLTLVTSAACTFFSACVGHQARVENRQERRADRQEEPQATPVPKEQQ
jgi:hypothetical protein